MKIRNLDNGHTWQQRVREHDDVSNTIYSEEETWQQIRERLDGASKRKNRSWYWAAAASVVLFVAIKLCIPVSYKSIEHGLTKTSPIHKQNSNAGVPADTIQANRNIVVKTSNPGIKTAPHFPVDSQRLADAKKGSVLPSTVDSSITVSSDTASIPDDVAVQHGPLPTVHIEDLINGEPLPGNTTIKSLTVKKMIRLFGADFTKEQPPTKQGARTPNPSTIPNNQN